MAIRILTKAGVENTHIDEARGYNFDAANRSGIIQGVLNEGHFFASSSNAITLDTCELRIFGHRIIIDEPYTINFTNAPATTTRYSLIAEISVDNLSVPTFRLFIQQSNVSLITDNLYADISGQGIYQVEIGQFTLKTNITIEDVVRTITVFNSSNVILDYSYLQNQPLINNIQLIGNKTSSDLGLIDNTVNDLTNYYLKSETYSKTEVQRMIAQIRTVSISIKTTLPAPTGYTDFNFSKTIYLVPDQKGTNWNYYNEYIVVKTGSDDHYTYSWEKIGSTLPRQQTLISTSITIPNGNSIQIYTKDSGTGTLEGRTFELGYSFDADSPVKFIKFKIGSTYGNIEQDVTWIDISNASYEYLVTIAGGPDYITMQLGTSYSGDNYIYLRSLSEIIE